MSLADGKCDACRERVHGEPVAQGWSVAGPNATLPLGLLCPDCAEDLAGKLAWERLARRRPR